MYEENTQPRLTRTGKQVKFDGRHFADAASEDDAQAIVDALTWIGAKPPGEAHDRLMEFFS